jgi:hypothetical protein
MTTETTVNLEERIRQLLHHLTSNTASPGFNCPSSSRVRTNCRYPTALPRASGWRP